MAKQIDQTKDLEMTGFSIDGIKVYPSTLKLVAAGKERRLEPRIMDLLVYFARRPKEVVSKEQILKDVWGGVPVVEEALQRAISILRKTLGDDRDKPKYIETISKKGYRFLIHPKPFGKENVLEIDYQKKTLKVSPLFFLIGAALIVLLTYLIINRGSDVPPVAPAAPEGESIETDENDAPAPPVDEG